MFHDLHRKTQLGVSRDDFASERVVPLICGDAVIEHETPMLCYMFIVGAIERKKHILGESIPPPPHCAEVRRARSAITAFLLRCEYIRMSIRGARYV